MEQFFVHRKDGTVYGWNETTADLVRNGFNTDVQIVDADDKRVKDYFAKIGKAKPATATATAKSKKEPVELPASLLEQKE